jgi:glutamyl-tRNA(Gln) amidotransferase subunit D
MTKILEVDYKGEIIKGPLLKEDENYFMIKLKSGYNANLKKENCKIISESEVEDKKIESKTKLKTNKKLPNVTILHTGGTIASKVDYRTGAVSSKFTPEELMGLFPELNELANIDTKLIGNIFSEDMRFAEYNLMLKEIQLAIKNNTDGIIIAHGTDTLHYTSAALQYATKNLNIPVILVGAQRSSDRASSDAFSNLTSAVDFIIYNKSQNLKFNRVGICMHETINDDTYTILDGINAKKMHSTQRDAFKQINYEPYARISDNGKTVKILRKDLQTKQTTENFTFTEFKEELKIGFFKVHPNMFSWELDNLTQYDAVVIEGTGIGNLPQNDDNSKQDKAILNKLHEICDKTKVLAGVQTVYGEVSLDIYSRGRDIQNAGVIGNRTNLTTESIFCRIAHILSKENIDFEKEWDSNLEGFEKISKQIN